VDVPAQRLLITNFRGTAQELDLTLPANCGGFGRIHHFKRATDPGWPPNPLPIDPAVRALGLTRTDVVLAQAFQNAICNWRCWYCFVPFDLLAARPEYSGWHSAASLLDLYEAEPDRAPVIDLTGGQPDLTPEWVPWMMRELERRGLGDSVYLWSDDNLSNDYFWKFLSEADQAYVATYPKYGRVGCFKGFDAASFAFNTKASADLFDQQFTLFGRHLSSGVDLYAYATFTTPTAEGIADGMRSFVDRLQALDEDLPLRTVPLRITLFNPVGPRLHEEQTAALEHQERAIERWQRELDERFTAAQRAANVVDIKIGARRR
jgi:organic radical activating enzyme